MLSAYNIGDDVVAAACAVARPIHGGPAACHAYRLALTGMFPQCRSGEWKRRRDELMAELAPDEVSIGRFFNRACAVEAKLVRLIKGWG